MSNTGNIEQEAGALSHLSVELGMVKALVWHEWTTGRKVPDDVPVDELLLVDLGKNEKRRYKTAQFSMKLVNEKFGCIGDAFYFDVKPIRWASIQHLIDA